MVTGAGGGIGIAVAEHLAVLGYDLVLSVHSDNVTQEEEAFQRTTAALTKRINAAVAAACGTAAKHVPPNIKVCSLDLGSFASVRGFADEVLRAVGEEQQTDATSGLFAPLGLLVCNAGVMYQTYILTHTLRSRLCACSMPQVDAL